MSRWLLQSKTVSVKVAVAVVIVGVLVAVTFKLLASRLLVDQKSLNDVEAVLSNYSEVLSTGQIKC